jgi:hypothetical protein
MRPSIKQIRNILGFYVKARNDSRAGGGRIKLDINLSKEQENYLEQQLSSLYPEYTISVSDSVVKLQGDTNKIVTVIHYYNLDHVLKAKVEREQTVTESLTAEPVVVPTAVTLEELYNADTSDPARGVAIGCVLGLIGWILIATYLYFFIL